jgi:hypothetical protein
MLHYQSFDPQTELNGTSTEMFLKSIMHDDIEHILKHHGLSQIDPEGWYPTQAVLDVFNEVAEEGVNASPTFVSCGMAAVESALAGMSPQMKSMSLQEFCANYSARWQTLHRNGDAGSVEFQLVEENHIVMTLRVPYPDDVMYGVFYAYARFFMPKGKHVTVAYDEKLPRREQGGETTVIHIRVKD